MTTSYILNPKLYTFLEDEKILTSENNKPTAPLISSKEIVRNIKLDFKKNLNYKFLDEINRSLFLQQIEKSDTSKKCKMSALLASLTTLIITILTIFNNLTNGQTNGGQEVININTVFAEPSTPIYYHSEAHQQRAALDDNSEKSNEPCEFEHFDDVSYILNLPCKLDIFKKDMCIAPKKYENILYVDPETIKVKRNKRDHSHENYNNGIPYEEEIKELILRESIGTSQTIKDLSSLNDAYFDFYELANYTNYLISQQDALINFHLIYPPNVLLDSENIEKIKYTNILVEFDAFDIEKSEMIFDYKNFTVRLFREFIKEENDTSDYLKVEFKYLDDDLIYEDTKDLQCLTVSFNLQFSNNHLESFNFNCLNLNSYIYKNAYTYLRDLYDRLEEKLPTNFFKDSQNDLFFKNEIVYTHSRFKFFKESQIKTISEKVLNITREIDLHSTEIVSNTTMFKAIMAYKNMKSEQILESFNVQEISNPIIQNVLNLNFKIHDIQKLLSKFNLPKTISTNDLLKSELLNININSRKHDIYTTVVNNLETPNIADTFLSPFYYNFDGSYDFNNIETKNSLNDYFFHIDNYKLAPNDYLTQYYNNIITKIDGKSTIIIPWLREESFDVNVYIGLVGVKINKKQALGTNIHLNWEDGEEEYPKVQIDLNNVFNFFLTMDNFRFEKIVFDLKESYVPPKVLIEKFTLNISIFDGNMQVNWGNPQIGKVANRYQIEFFRLSQNIRKNFTKNQETIFALKSSPRADMTDICRRDNWMVCEKGAGDNCFRRFGLEFLITAHQYNRMPIYSYLFFCKPSEINQYATKYNFAIGNGGRFYDDNLNLTFKIELDTDIIGEDIMSYISIDTLSIPFVDYDEAALIAELNQIATRVDDLADRVNDLETYIFEQEKILDIIIGVVGIIPDLGQLISNGLQFSKTIIKASRKLYSRFRVSKIGSFADEVSNELKAIKSTVTYNPLLSLDETEKLAYSTLYKKTAFHDSDFSKIQLHDIKLDDLFNAERKLDIHELTNINPGAFMKVQHLLFEEYENEYRKIFGNLKTPFGHVVVHKSPIESIGIGEKWLSKKFLSDRSSGFTKGGESFLSNDHFQFPFHTSVSSTLFEYEKDGEIYLTHRFSGIGEPSSLGPTNYKNPRAKVGYVKIQYKLNKETRELELVPWNKILNVDGEQLYTSDDVYTLTRSFYPEHINKKVKDSVKEMTTQEQFDLLSTFIINRVNTREVIDSVPISNAIFHKVIDDLFYFDRRGNNFKYSLWNNNCQHFAKSVGQLFTKGEFDLQYLKNDYAVFAQGLREKAYKMFGNSKFYHQVSDALDKGLERITTKYIPNYLYSTFKNYTLMFVQ